MARRTRIRPASDADAPALARVGVDTFRAAHRGQVPDALLCRLTYEDSARNWWLAIGQAREVTPPDTRILVLEDLAAGAPEVVAFAMAGPCRPGEPPGAAPGIEPDPATTGEVYSLYVAPSHQRQGFGRRLVRASARFLAGSGKRSLVIRCLAANVPARRFYAALGGRAAGSAVTVDDGVPLAQVTYAWSDLRVLYAPARGKPRRSIGHE